MATSQQVRSQTKQTQWSDIFPNEQVTETQSALFVKKLLAVAVSSISYLRALFPENAFGDRCLEDVNLKILRDDPACPEARRVIQWMRGCFDALEKKYLRAVLVGIYEDPDDPDTVIEQYSFKFAYGDGAGVNIYRNGAQIASAKSDSETKKATKRLLRTIVLLSQTLSPLPDDVLMTMKLLYYDEVTPEDYNPPGFKDCNCDDFYFKEEPLNIKVGDVATQFHSFKLRVKTKNHDLEEDQEEITTVPENDDKLLEANEDVNDSVSFYQNEDQDQDSKMKENEVLRECSEEKLTSNTRVSTPASFVIPDEEQSPEIVTKCPCGVNEDDGIMILCANCNTWQHATCFAILKAEEAPETHYCVECAQKSNDFECTDKSLAMDTDLKKVQAKCLWRRTLLAVSEITRILAPNLSKRLGVPLPVATSLLKRLEAEGFVKTGGKAKRFGKLVQKNEIIGRGFDKYFRNIDDEEEEDKENKVMNLISEKAAKMEISHNTHVASPNSVKKGSKRKSGEVVSSKNKDLRFQISDSQPSPSSDITSKKRRKRASVSAEPMCV